MTSWFIRSRRLLTPALPMPRFLLAIMLVLAGCSGPAANAPAPVIAGLDAADPNVAQVLQEQLDVAMASLDDGVLRGNLGLAYEANGYEQAALASYGQAEALAPDEFEWPYLLALLVAHQGEPEQALAHLARSLKINPDYVSSWLWRGNLLLDLDQPDAALQAFEQARKSGAGAPADIGLARVLLRQADPEQALGLLEPLSVRLSHPYVFRLLGRALRDLGRMQEATVALDQAKDATQFRWPDEVGKRKTQFIAGFGRRLLSAEALIVAHKPDQALPILEDLASARPTHVTLLNHLAVAYKQTGQQERSMATLAKALALAPEYYPIHLNLAVAFDDRGDYDTALNYIDQAIRIHPTFGMAHQRRGVVLMHMERYAEARNALETAIRYDARDPQLFYFAGVIESTLQHWPESVRHFQRAVQMDARFTKAHVHLARSLGELRRIEEARHVLQTAEALGAEIREIRMTRSWLDRLEASGL